MQPKTFLITRPIHQAHGLADKIHALGHQTILFPALELFALAPGYLVNPIDYDSCIFISPAAVEFAVSWLSQAPRGSILTIGADTAQAVAQQGWGIAQYPLEFNRDALLTLPILQNVTHKKILLCQSREANPTIAQVLTQRGAKVKVLTCYTCRLPSIKNYPDLTPLDIVICTSIRSLENVLGLLGSDLRAKRWLVSSEKLRHYAAGRGIALPPYVAENAGDDAILRAIKHWFN